MKKTRGGGGAETIKMLRAYDKGIKIENRNKREIKFLWGEK